MQLPDRAEGASPELRRTEGDRLKEKLKYMLGAPCPVCHAKPGEKCFDYRRNRKQRDKVERRYWDEWVHFRREQNVIRSVTRRLKGK